MKKRNILMNKTVHCPIHLYIKIDDIYKDIAKDVETRFHASN